MALNDEQAIVFQRIILLGGLAAVLFAVGLSLVPFTPPLSVTGLGRTLETGCGPAVVSVFDDDAPTIRAEDQVFGEPVLACRDEARRRLAKSGIIVVLAAVGVVLGTLLIGARPRRPAAGEPQS